jgi:gamma-glutamyltranspeptidase/glutathione hydrolase
MARWSEFKSCLHTILGSNINSKRGVMKFFTLKLKTVSLNILILLLAMQIPLNSQAATFKAHKIAMSCANPHAIEAGRNIAASGGNVVDVAVSMALVMSVTNPYFAALGGGGFALVDMNNQVDVLDFREQAPQATNSEYFVKENESASITGGKAVAVPSMPAGLYELHKKYGKIHWSRLFNDPIRLATKGFPISGELADRIQSQFKRFNADGQRIFSPKEGGLYKPGMLFKQPELARVLNEIRNRKLESFYHGTIAKDIVDSTQAAGGSLTLNDMKSYKVKWRNPLKATYEGYDVYLMPPPSIGGVVIQAALDLTEKIKLSTKNLYSVEEFHLLGELLNKAFSIRNDIQDPDYKSVNLSQILNAKVISDLEKNINFKTASQTQMPKNTSNESKETTHLSVLDNEGHGVSMTITLNGSFGSGVVTKKYGIALNNEMDDFTTRPNQPNTYGLVQGQGNIVEPGKRPLSSMSPTLVKKNNQVVLSIGAPGGPRIISSVYQSLYRLLGRKQTLERAIESPRVHHQTWPNILYIEPQKMMFEVSEGLKAKKHILEESWTAKVYGVYKNGEFLEAVADSRGEGFTGGI